MTEYRDGVTEHCDEATDWRKGKAEGRKDGISGEESQTELKNNFWAIIVKNCSMRRSDRGMWRKDGGNVGEMVGMTERWWKWQGCGERRWRVGRAEEWGWNEWNDDKEAEWGNRWPGWWINDRDDEWKAERWMNDYKEREWWNKWLGRR